MWNLICQFFLAILGVKIITKAEVFPSLRAFGLPFPISPDLSGLEGRDETTP